MPHAKTTVVLTPDLADQDSVRLLAEEVARRLGEIITITDDYGDELYRAAPPASLLH